jgi:hypothetical protein
MTSMRNNVRERTHFLIANTSHYGHEAASFYIPLQTNSYCRVWKTWTPSPIYTAIHTPINKVTVFVGTFRNFPHILSHTEASEHWRQCGTLFLGKALNDVFSDKRPVAVLLKVRYSSPPKTLQKFDATKRNPMFSRHVGTDMSGVCFWKQKTR